MSKKHKSRRKPKKTTFPSAAGIKARNPVPPPEPPKPIYVIKGHFGIGWGKVGRFVKNVAIDVGRIALSILIGIGCFILCVCIPLAAIYAIGWVALFLGFPNLATPQTNPIEVFTGVLLTSGVAIIVLAFYLIYSLIGWIADLWKNS